MVVVERCAANAGMGATGGNRRVGCPKVAASDIALDRPRGWWAERGAVPGRGCVDQKLPFSELGAGVNEEEDVKVLQSHIP